MPRHSLDYLLQPLLLKKIEGVEGGEVSGLSYHSAKVQAGDLFFALDGRHREGWRYAREAVASGAVAAVVPERALLEGVPLIRVPDVRLALALIADRFYGHPSRSLRVIGVTGTNGKTTTTHLIDHLFRSRGEKTGLVGTISYRLGASVIPSSATTPEASDLQELMAKLVSLGAGRLTMEVSSHALEQKRVAGCRFAVVVNTNVTSEHLDFHRTFEAYREAKARLFSMMGTEFDDYRGPRVAVLNADDESFPYLQRRCSAQVVTYGLKRRADVAAAEIKMDRQGLSFRCLSFAGRERIRLRLPGIFNVYNALAAIAVGLVEGFSLEEIREALAGFGGVPGRFELIEGSQDFLVVVDYAHTPDGLENVLKAARDLTRGRLITVFGCGGERDRSKRPLMGEVAGRYSDYAVVTSDNPRGEDPEAIVADILPGLSRSPLRSYRVVLDRREAIKLALEAAGPGDLVLIAGKGHEEYQVIKGQVFPFSDRQVALELLAGRGTRSDLKPCC